MATAVASGTNAQVRLWDDEINNLLMLLPSLRPAAREAVERVLRSVLPEIDRYELRSAVAILDALERSSRVCH